MKVDPEEFASQVNYLAAIGRMVVPRAFVFARCKVLFVGHGPFDLEDIATLLPDSTDWHEHGAAPDGFVPDVVVLGRDDFEKGAVKAALNGMAGTRATPKVIPQEGLLDELLFGHNWWSEKAAALEALGNSHRGLQAARSLGALGPAGVEKPQPKKGVAKTAKTSKVTQGSNKGSVGTHLYSPFGTLPEKIPDRKQELPTHFSWPSTEVKETRGGGESEYDLQDRSRLKGLGYDTNQSPSVRWRILATRAVPELGLPKVAGLIAWFCRSRKQQRGGRQKFARAIGEWEHDLDRLKREVYPNYRPHFNWPRSEP